MDLSYNCFLRRPSRLSFASSSAAAIAATATAAATSADAATATASVAAASLVFLSFITSLLNFMILFSVHFLVDFMGACGMATCIIFKTTNSPLPLFFVLFKFLLLLLLLLLQLMCICSALQSLVMAPTAATAALSFSLASLLKFSVSAEFD